LEKKKKKKKKKRAKRKCSTIEVFFTILVSVFLFFSQKLFRLSFTLGFVWVLLLL